MALEVAAELMAQGKENVSLDGDGVSDGCGVLRSPNVLVRAGGPSSGAKSATKLQLQRRAPAAKNEKAAATPSGSARKDGHETATTPATAKKGGTISTSAVKTATETKTPRTARKRSGDAKSPRDTETNDVEMEVETAPAPSPPPVASMTRAAVSSPAAIEGLVAITPVRSSPRLKLKAAAAAAVAGAAASPAVGPVQGAAATKTPSRLGGGAPRRKGLTGGGAVRILVAEGKEAGAAEPEPELEPIFSRATTRSTAGCAGSRLTVPTAAAAAKAKAAAAPAAAVRTTRKAEVPRLTRSKAATATAATAAVKAAPVGAKRTRAQANAPAPPVVPKKTVASKSSAAASHRAAPGSRLQQHKTPTVPKSPAFTRAKRARHAVKSSEELALEKAAAAAAAEKRAREREARRAGSRGAGYVPPKPATKPVTPNFQRSHSMATRAVVAHGLTQQSSPFRSIAEKFAAFGEKTLRTGTPPRTTRAYVQGRAATVPRSPAISRPVAPRKPPAKTSEEIELEKLAAAPKFKARPLRKSVLQGAGDASMRARAAADARRAAAATAAAAKPQPMAALTGRKRTAEAAMEAEAAARKRRAMEAKGELGFNGAPAPTVPQSPRFATTRRAALRAPPPAREAAAGGIRGGAARVISSSGAPPHSSRSSDKASGQSSDGGWVPGVTQPAEFNLTTERRGAYAKRVMERRMAEEEEVAAAARMVRARPLPTSTAQRTTVFKPPAKQLTQPEPFKLRSEALHEYEKRRVALRQKEEEEAAAAAAKFKARALPVTHFNPMFEIEPSSAPLTETVETATHGARRAEQRAKFDAEMADKAAAAAAEAAAAAAEEAEEEERQRKELRKSMAFKAKPIPNYQELASKGVRRVKAKELTCPASPGFATARRTRSSTMRC